jgi:heavy metal sensor kinase
MLKSDSDPRLAAPALRFLPTSLRNRLILGALIATLAVYIAAAALLYGAIRASLLGEFDAGLKTRAQALIGITELRERGIRLQLDPGQKPDFAMVHPNDGFVLLTSEGRTISGTNFSGGEPAWNEISFGDHDSPRFGFITLSPGVRGRYLAEHFSPRWDQRDWPRRPPPPTTARLVVVGDTAELHDKLNRLTALLAGTFGLSMLVATLVLSLVIRRGLRPMSLLARKIESIGEEDLFRRVDLPQPPDEIRPLVQRLNELLQRLEDSFTRERAFTADVAHELRTPLAGLTTALEVSLSRPRDSNEYQQTVAQCLGASRSMRGMVENLLTLARADARQISAQRHPIDLAALLHQTWQPFSSRAAARNLTVNWLLDADAVIASDPGLLGMVISNLFDNAVSYADTGGRIDVELRQSAAEISIRIINTGSQIPTEDTARVFERFWRGDASRTGDGQHFGLGLAMCQRIMSLLGGTIAVTTGKQENFAVTLDWPK